jgi:hypothetical protein
MTRRRAANLFLFCASLSVSQAFLSRFSFAPQRPPSKVAAGLHGELDAIFGSDNLTAGSVKWGEDDDYDVDRKEYSDRVVKLMDESEQSFRDKRKAKQWGDFANVSTSKELKEILSLKKMNIDVENERKAKIALQSGVEFMVLDPRDQGIMDDSGGLKIQAGSAKSWFADMDNELKEEWRALVGSRKAGEEDEEEEEEEESGASDVQVEVGGKIVARDALSGVRVGSAGGWSLEVFPGDFVVHRKYGIGRFDRTCLRPKTKLTPEEQLARDNRRAEVLTTELRKRKNGVTPEDIQAIRSKFGTETDTDPISNPQTTVLEITYSDAVVHVPVDRAYRLSRYRAGDAVIKPKLSRARSEAWSRAKKKAEENTLQLAQDVLALYATRETLYRQALDPAVEEQIKEFESTFQFTPPPDQIKCFEDVENDMVWRNRPMDRLVCGDVGFGKTEVAFRALYRVVANGRQAALLAPTSVLASQHYKNILKRFGPGTPFNVKATLLRRGAGKTTKTGALLREQIASGEIELIVGTHALLSHDVKYKDLGLLVVDEEQRFGVKQKERLKLICDGIDVLTLSAT